MLDEHLSTESRSLQGRDGRGLLDERVMRFQNQNTNADAGPSTGANATVAKGQQEGDKKRRRSTRIKESNDTDVEPRRHQSAEDDSSLPYAAFASSSLQQTPPESAGFDYVSEQQQLNQDGPTVRPNVASSAIRHAAGARRARDARFFCTVPGCGSNFTTKSNLQGHMRSHANERPYVCHGGCEKAFTRQSDLNRHQRKVHPDMEPSMPPAKRPRRDTDQGNESEPAHGSVAGSPPMGMPVHAMPRMVPMPMTMPGQLPVMPYTMPMVPVGPPPGIMADSHRQHDRQRSSDDYQEGDDDDEEEEEEEELSAYLPPPPQTYDQYPSFQPQAPPPQTYDGQGTRPGSPPLSGIHLLLNVALSHT